MTLHVITKKNKNKKTVKRDWVEEIVKERPAGSTLSCGSLSGWGRCFQMLRRSLLSPWHLKNKTQLSLTTVSSTG